eukprot:10651136-Ditylum_brightwellii.AAC.1
MSPFFTTIGVGDGEKSLFCHKFVTCKDLCKDFVKYYPQTFKCNTYAGEGVHNTVITSNENNGSTPEQTIANFLF